MNVIRFLSKTNTEGITTTPVVVVMLLLFLSIACSSEKKEIVDVAFDPEKTEKFDTLFHTEASIKADTAYYYTKRELWELIGHVEVESLQGEHFETSRLFWNQKEEKVYSDEYIRIEQEDKIVTGIGFESNQNMTQYKIFNSQGIFPVEDKPAENPPDSAQVKVEN